MVRSAASFDRRGEETGCLFRHIFDRNVLYAVSLPLCDGPLARRIGQTSYRDIPKQGIVYAQNSMRAIGAHVSKYANGASRLIQFNLQELSGWPDRFAIPVPGVSAENELDFSDTRKTALRMALATAYAELHKGKPESFYALAGEVMARKENAWIVDRAHTFFR